MTTIQDILKEFREAATSNRDLGDKFERLMLCYFKSDPQYQDLFSNVWMWMDFPKRNNAPDTGIDLVAEERATGEYCAIQCKFYNPNHTLEKKDIDSFFTASGKAQFTRRFIVSTTDKWSKNAEDAIKNQQIPVTVLGVQDLVNSPVDWSKFNFKSTKPLNLKPKKVIRPHQQIALDKVVNGFSDADRGKIIMACGTGKTFTALKIAEHFAENNALILFLVPSISLLSQTLKEWTAETQKSLHSIAVCSDVKVGKNKNADDGDITTNYLAFPPTTKAQDIIDSYNFYNGKKDFTVIFSTYQSIQAIADAQQKGLPEFNLIICDEAHRTTGVTLSGEDESHFVRVHNQDFIKGKKRLYMTATPKIFSDDTKTQANENSAYLCSMDNEDIYGKEFYRLGFGEAVNNGLLTDYKVLVLAVDEKYISATFQRQLADEQNELKLEDKAKVVGCWNALSNRFIDSDIDDITPMKKAVAFSSSIENSNNITQYFVKTINDYKSCYPNEENLLICELDHVDGKQNSLIRNSKLDWLKEDTPENVCRILSNVRCLSEGVDVPSLDAVLFFSPRNSIVDVVQSVGRVMRKAEGKKYGYIILPVGIPADTTPENALKDNNKYKVIWQVLQALRAHDDRFNTTVNQIDLNHKRPDNINVIGVGGDKTDKVSKSSTQSTAKNLNLDFNFSVDEWRNAIFAKIVTKCGDRRYWENWATDIASIADTHITRIKSLLSNSQSEARLAFDDFLSSLHNTLNPNVTEDEAIEMLAQHLITKPVFDALFDGYEFTKSNPVSLTMQRILDVLDGHSLAKETETLSKFYQSVRDRASGIDNAEGKQKIIIELYDKFFKNAFPRLVARLGIVYTPVEVVDFIIHSADVALKQEFGVSLSDEGVHILDPFTGTGTFMVRLLQSGLIKPEDLERKYNSELHANEIVLLAYYIAAINIEETYHYLSQPPAPILGNEDQPLTPILGNEDQPLTSILGNKDQPPTPILGNEDQPLTPILGNEDQPLTPILGNKDQPPTPILGNDKNPPELGGRGAYTPFNGIVLTDTFQMFENEGTFLDEIFPENNERGNNQKGKDITVIIGNPPYSAKQESENDGNKNIKYEKLDDRIRNSYVEYSTATLKNSLYDSYIRAFRWASDRIKDKGIVSFVSNGSFIDNNAMDGVRKCLADEFTSIYCFNLRGNTRTSGEQGRKENNNIFGSGSRTTISIIVLIKNPSKSRLNKVFYYDIGDYLNRDQKLNNIKTFCNISGIEWEAISPNENYDWINQRNELFESFFSLGDKKDKTNKTIFDVYSGGVKTNRDAWVYNFSEQALINNMTRMIAFYNSQVEIYKLQKIKKKVDQFIDNDPKKISWSSGLKEDINKFSQHDFYLKSIRLGLYRPFCKQKLYFDQNFNERQGRIPKFFPNPKLDNLVITITGQVVNKDFSALMVDLIPNLCLHGAGNPCQCFPLYTYEKQDEATDLFTSHNTPALVKKDNISDDILTDFQKVYHDLTICKEDIFYFVYGVLHSPEYKQRFSSDLKKMIPRIPFTQDFWTFSKTGRELAYWHLNYETIEPYPVEEYKTELYLEDKDYRVEKMRFGKNAKAIDKTTIIYNHKITLSNIPLEAYEYVVNGKSAIEWIIDRYQIKIDKDSGIKNDPNDWSEDPRYILDLVKRIIRVSLESVKLINGLPPLNEQNIKVK